MGNMTVDYEDVGREQVVHDGVSKGPGRPPRQRRVRLIAPDGVVPLVAHSTMPEAEGSLFDAWVHCSRK